VNIAFLDDAGHSRREPIVVVGGVLIHGEETSEALARTLDDIAAEFIPEADREGFVFHAKDIFHGGGYFNDPKAWPRERRWPILRALALLPGEFGIPVVFGYLNKAQYVLQMPADPHPEAALSNHHAELMDLKEHSIAFTNAETAIELQMRGSQPDQTCTVIAENAGRVRQSVAMAHGIRRDSGIASGNVPAPPTATIMNTPCFAQKADSRPLQLADTCAFLILRRLTRQQSSQAFFEALAPQLTWDARVFGERMGSEPVLVSRVH